MRERRTRAANRRSRSTREVVAVSDGGCAGAPDGPKSICSKRASRASRSDMVARVVLSNVWSMMSLRVAGRRLRDLSPPKYPC